MGLGPYAAFRDRNYLERASGCVHPVALLQNGSGGYSISAVEGRWSVLLPANAVPVLVVGVQVHIAHSEMSNACSS